MFWQKIHEQKHKSKPSLETATGWLGKFWSHEIQVEDMSVAKVVKLMT